MINSGLGWRITGIKIITILAFFVLLTALIRTQLLEGQYYRAMSDNNRVQEVPIHAPRGIIYDRNGIPLVANLPSFRLNGESISKVEAIDFMAQASPSSGLLEVDSTRSYLYGTVTAHVLGYLSKISPEDLKNDSSYLLGDSVGRGGVEEEYEAKLRGKDGAEIVETDANGREQRVLSTVAPQPGQSLTLSIDINLQKAAYEEIKDKKAVVVATNPNTGGILALVSAPSFDPGAVANYLNNPDEPLFNRAISGTYPAGSTFKIVNAVAGLETGKIDENTTIDDPGVLVIGPYRFPNWKYLQDGGTQGVLNVVGALQKSNDIFFYKAGEAVGIDDLAAWAAKFGLGKPLGIDLPGEAGGLIRQNREWYLGDTYHTAIGQGDLLVTPLQVNGWTSVIANGGKLCKPHVLGDANCQDLGIKKKTIDLVKQGIVAACNPGGTAYPLFGFKVPLACKTGTAEYGDPQGRTHAWLTAFGPVDKPTIALTVLVEGGGGGGEGSDVAAPIARKILEEWFK